MPVRVPSGYQRHIIAVVIGALILAMGWWAIWRSPQVQECKHRVPLKIVSSTEKDKELRDLAEEYNAAERPAGAVCAQVSVVGVTSGAAKQILAEKLQPTPDALKRTPGEITQQQLRNMGGVQVWMPSSSLWVDLLHVDVPLGAVPQDNPSVARSPLVVAMTRQLAQRLGWTDTPPTWGKVMSELASGKLHYRQENPATSTSGALATVMIFYTSAQREATGQRHGAAAVLPENLPDSPEDVRRLTPFVSKVQGAAPEGFVNDSTDILREWAKTEVPDDTAFLIQEQMVFGYNNGQYSQNPGEHPVNQLIAVHPTADPADGAGRGRYSTVAADHPYVVLPAPYTTAGQREAAKDFLAFLHQDRQELCAVGFHAVDGSAPRACARNAPAATGSPLPSVGEMPLTLATDDAERPGTMQVLALPPGQSLKVLVEQWKAAKPPRRVAVLLDVSGSQTIKPDIVTALGEGVDQLREKNDVLMIWQVAGDARYRGAHADIVPFRTYDTESVRTAIRTKGVRPQVATEKTGLLTSVDDALRVFTSDRPADDTTVDAVIVLSDGIDDWTSGTTGMLAATEGYCSSWEDRDPRRAQDRQTRILTVHYDTSDYDSQTRADGHQLLKKIATCTGGHSYDSSGTGGAQDPAGANPLGVVFQSLMSGL